MSNITDELTKMIRENQGNPFLFIGSGLSRRYLGLEDWKGLLEKFSITKEFGYYLSSANEDLATAAGLLAKDFHELWWSDSQYKESRNSFKETKNQSSALKFEISKYLKQLTKNNVNPAYETEVRMLEDSNIDGIITTNWDTLLEQLFPDYVKYIGQKELIFSNSYEVGEIYKIHGCSTEPNSLVLTGADYNKFQERNSYLTAKLITIFVEHPVIFLGYSLSDKNIQNILTNIVKCLDGDSSKLDRLRRNLIFVQRSSGKGDSITNSSITIQEISLPITVIETDNFCHVYQALHDVRRKIPVKILRMCKEQIYELAYYSNDNKQHEKLYVMDIEKITNYEDVEVIVGFGIQDKVKQINDLGYLNIENKDILIDAIENDSKYDSKKLLTLVIADSPLNVKYIPIFKYLRLLNIDSEDKYKIFKEENGCNLDRFINIKFEDILKTNKSYPRKFKNSTESVLDIIKSKYELADKMRRIIFSEFCFNELKSSNDTLDELGNFLRDISKDILNGKNNAAIAELKKLIILYDLIKYGWE